MKILYVATISLTINTFFKAHIDMLVKEGHHVDIACNYSELPIDPVYLKMGCNFYQIDFSRSPLSPDNLKAYKQLKKVIGDGEYDIVHCHTPNASVITRLICKKFRKKNGLKVFYTAHGFHFYKGAPKLNWMVYYPIEKICSRYTDKLITINKEDYELAQKSLKATEIYYVPGVGIDVSAFEGVTVDKSTKRVELGIRNDVVLFTSVGELSVRKNQIVMLKALAKIDNDNIHYAIVGCGDMEQELRNAIEEYQLSDRVHMLGYRRDVAEIYKASDVCCLPSLQEGLPVALIEGMACGLPVICSRIRGNVDLIDKHGELLFDSHDPQECYAAIRNVLRSDRLQMGNENKIRAMEYSTEKILLNMKDIYEIQG